MVSPTMAEKMRWKWNLEKQATSARSASGSSSPRCASMWSMTRLIRATYSCRRNSARSIMPRLWSHRVEHLSRALPRGLC